LPERPFAMSRKPGFISISLERYVELRLRRDPDVERQDLVRRLEHARAASERGEPPRGPPRQRG